VKITAMIVAKTYFKEIFLSLLIYGIYTPCPTDLPLARSKLTDIHTPHHMNPCNQILTVMKYGVNRVTLVGNVGDEPMVSEWDGEAFVVNCRLPPISTTGTKKGRK